MKVYLVLIDVIRQYENNLPEIWTLFKGQKSKADLQEYTLIEFILLIIKADHEFIINMYYCN